MIPPDKLRALLADHAPRGDSSTATDRSRRTNVPKYAKTYTIRFFGDPPKTVVRRRGRKFVYLSPIVIGPVTVWPRVLTQKEIEACYVRGGQVPEGGRTLHFRGERFIPAATKSS